MPATPPPPSYERLVRARAKVAMLIERHGDWLMPHFERLDEACVERETRQDRLALAIEAVKLVQADNTSPENTYQRQIR